MDRLWSPWRYQYVKQLAAPGECIFCAKPSAEHDRDNLIVHRAQHCFVLLNLYPYTTGHLMIAPYLHVATLEETPEEVAQEVMQWTRHSERVLRQTYRPDGINLGMNVGASAGAGVAGHIHMHVLPRWAGDANFMTTVAETRVLPEDLQVTYTRLTQAGLWERP